MNFPIFGALSIIFFVIALTTSYSQWLDTVINDKSLAVLIFLSYLISLNFGIIGITKLIRKKDKKLFSLIINITVIILWVGLIIYVGLNDGIFPHS